MVKKCANVFLNIDIENYKTSSSVWSGGYWEYYTSINHCFFKGGAGGVIVIVVENGHDDTSSNPGRDWLHFT